MNGIPPFAIHDPGCNCWPHVNASDLDEATIAGAVTEYREGKRAIDRAVAAERVRIAAAVEGLDDGDPYASYEDCRAAVLAIVEIAAAVRELPQYRIAALPLAPLLDRAAVLAIVDRGLDTTA